jgi:co-chaperonin GroES (HSP10)
MTSPTKLQVTGYRVIVKQVPVKTVTESGIVLESGDAVKRRQAGQIWATIVAIGGVAFTGPDWAAGDRDMYKPGTRVLYRRYSGVSFNVGESADRYELVSDSDILMPIPDGVEFNVAKSEA